MVLASGAVQRACAYYNATRYEAVLAFAAPAEQELTSVLSTKVVQNHSLSSSSTIALMGNRHVSFLSVRAADALSSLALAHLPSFDLDKPADMILPNLLPSMHVSALWLLEGCGMFVPSAGACEPVRLRGSSGATPQYRCDDAQLQLRQRHAVSSPPSTKGWAQRCRLRPGVGMWDAFLYMYPHERASAHVCTHVACLPPLHSSRRHMHTTGSRTSQHAMASGSASTCEQGRGPRWMAVLNVTKDGVYGRSKEVGRAAGRGVIDGDGNGSASESRRRGGDGGADGGGSDQRVRFLSIHLQGNAKRLGCLRYLMAAANARLHQHSPAVAAPSMARATSARTHSNAPRHQLQAFTPRAPALASAASAARPAPHGRAAEAMDAAMTTKATAARWFHLDWQVEAAHPQPAVCLSDVAFVVMTSAATSERAIAVSRTWAHAVLHQPRAIGRTRLLLMSDRDQVESREQTTAALRGRHSYWDAQSRHFEGMRLLYLAAAPVAEAVPNATLSHSSPPLASPLRASLPLASLPLASLPRASLPAHPSLPRWTLLVDDDSFVNLPALLRYASRFDADEPLLIGHVLNGIWPRVRGFSGGAGMLLSRAALQRFGQALASGAMPLPQAGRRESNDRHIARWAPTLGVRCVHTNAFWYAALPADARLVATVGARLGREIEEYVGSNTAEGLRQRADFAVAALSDARGALDPQVLSAVVVHRLPARLMYVLHDKLSAFAAGMSAPMVGSERCTA